MDGGGVSLGLQGRPVPALVRPGEWVTLTRLAWAAAALATVLAFATAAPAALGGGIAVF